MSLKKTNKSTAPEAMTWGKAVPALAIAGIFDALGFLFGMFWLFGPALAAAYCTAVAGETLATWTFGLLGTKTAGAACAAGAMAAGSLLSEPLIMFGTAMAMATEFFGWLAIGFVLMMTNARIFKEHPSHSFLFGASLGLSEIPLIGSLPVLTGATVRMYYSQIKKDKEILEKHKKESANTQLQDRRQRAAELMQIQESRLNQAQQQNAAAQEEMYGEKQEDGGSEDGKTNVIRFPSEKVYGSAVRRQNIPDKLRKAA